jgi:hypothetical protein
MSELDDEMLEFADRLGAKADVDNAWFQKLVAHWRLRDGSRSAIMELNLLGRQLYIWTDNGQREISAEILGELDIALSQSSSHPNAELFADEVLGGLLIEVYQHRESRPNEAPLVETELIQMMGDETKLLWFLKLSTLNK